MRTDIRKAPEFRKVISCRTGTGPISAAEFIGFVRVPPAYTKKCRWQAVE
jgi:hypothetical protein